MNNILILDIETSPSVCYTWKMWKANISQDMLVEGGYMMSCAMKWLGEDEIYYYESRGKDDSYLTAKVIEYLDKADYVIAHNAEKFDIPYIKYRAVVNKVSPPSPFKVIDTLRIAKKEFLFTRNTLENLAIELGCGNKLKHEAFSGFKLWSECLAGNNEAWNCMRDYNIQDVKTLEEVYMKLRPFYREHPNVGAENESLKPCCPTCGSHNVQSRGYYFTNVGKYKRLWCKDCGSWSRTRYGEGHIEVKKSILRSM